MLKAFTRIFRSRSSLSAEAEAAVLQQIAEALAVNELVDESPQQQQRPEAETLDLSLPAQRLAHLKRAGAYEEALEFALALIERLERRPGFSGRPSCVSWCYWEAAIICHLLKRPEDEVAILERFSNRYAERLAGQSRLIERLDRARSAIAQS
jgi:hypothetical protein